MLWRCVLAGYQHISLCVYIYVHVHAWVYARGDRTNGQRVYQISHILLSSNWRQSTSNRHNYHQRGTSGYILRSVQHLDIFSEVCNICSWNHLFLQDQFLTPPPPPPPYFGLCPLLRPPFLAMPTNETPLLMCHGKPPSSRLSEFFPWDWAYICVTDIQEGRHKEQLWITVKPFIQ